MTQDQSVRTDEAVEADGVGVSNRNSVVLTALLIVPFLLIMRPGLVPERSTASSAPASRPC